MAFCSPENETAILLAVTLNDHDRLAGVDWRAVDLRRLLRRVSNNRVLHRFIVHAQSLDLPLSPPDRELLAAVYRAAEERLDRFRRTIEFLHNSLGAAGIPFLVVKTFKFIDYVTFDVDTAVPYGLFGDAQRVLGEHGAAILPHPRKQGLHQRNCQKDGLLNIDLHRQFYWQGFEHIDLDFVWRECRPRTINGIECPCPALEVDFILHNVQLAYERYYVTLLDFLAVKYAIEQGGLNMDQIAGQVARYRWQGTYDALMRTLNAIHATLFDKPLMDSFPSCPLRYRGLPHIYPYWRVVAQFFEIARQQRQAPLFDFAYYHFTFMRYFLSGKRMFPYYRHWFLF